MSGCKRMARLAVWSIAVVLLSSCGARGDAELSEQAVATFHERLSKADFSAIYADSTDEFRLASQRQNNDYLVAIGKSVGTVASARKISLKTEPDSKGALVILEYQTTYSNGSGTEAFQFRVAGGKARLHQYSINFTPKR